MNYQLNRIYQVYEAAEKIYFTNHSNIVLMSDCHRGNGSRGDDFYKNKDIYIAALTYYYNNNYTYIEIGDGDELWKNESFSAIADAHKNVFLLLSKFHNENRLYFIFGNHDRIKKHDKFVSTNLFPMFGSIKVHEGLILNQRETNNELLLIHGHQLDFFNDKLWKISRFLVRYLWGPLQMLGIISPSNTSIRFCRKKTIDIKLMDWCSKENKSIAAGHTHNYLFPETGSVPYFNAGSCVYPQGITSLEIEHGNITLTAWHSKTISGATIYYREILGGPERFEDYFTID